MYPWQKKSWKSLQDMQDRLPHALLFHGQKGIGKLDFVRAFAQALLCEKPDREGRGCNQCASCRWFEERSHPDFRTLRPAILEADDGDVTEANVEATDAASNEPAEKKTRKAPSKEIRIEQVRALTDFLNIGTHRGGKRVVLLYPIEALNGFAANALLKMLEEPPPKTVFLMIAESLDRIMPTLLSRCHRVAMSLPNPVEAQDWLRLQEWPTEQIEAFLAETGGAPLATLELMKKNVQATDPGAMRQRVLDYLAQPEGGSPLALAEAIHKEYLNETMGWLQRWIFDCVAYLSTQGIRYYPNRKSQIETLVKRIDRQTLLRGLLGYENQLKSAQKVIEHPLNAKLFLENLLMRYAAIFSDSKRIPNAPNRS